MIVAPGSPRNQSEVWWRLQVKGVPRLRFRDKGQRLATALELGARLVELRVVRTPLRTEIHAVMKHPPCEMPKTEPRIPIGIDRGLKVRLALSDGVLVPARRPRQVGGQAGAEETEQGEEGLADPAEEGAYSR